MASDTYPQGQDYDEVDGNTYSLDEVDTPELEEVDMPTEEVDTPKATKKVNKAGGATRAPVPNGYITPVAFAKLLSDKLTREAVERGELDPETEEIRIAPQMVYSWVKAGKNESAQYPLKSYTEGGRDNLLKQDEAFKWYAERQERIAQRKTSGGKVTKAAKPADTGST
jgi:hypothetical protein